ncbi:hypothetical protein BROUX41_002091 [Berkeleyomyces rouxiae]
MTAPSSSLIESASLLWTEPGRARPPLPLSRLTPRLYVSHFLSTWNSRMFEFGAVLFLIAIYPGTLLPPSLYALARGIAATLFAPGLGTLVDTANRLSIVRYSILIQRLSVAASCAGLYVLYILHTPLQVPWHTGQHSLGHVPRATADEAPQTPVQIALFAAIAVLACSEKLASTLTTLAVERDWVVVLTTDEPAARARLNTRMRQIDLFCKLVSPLVIAILESMSTSVAILATAGMTLASVGPEVVFVAQIYNRVPALQRAPALPATVGSPSASLATTARAAFRHALVQSLRALPMYTRHATFLPSIALALLYLTVLSFAGQMAAFLRAEGFSSAAVGAARVVSTALEISATLLAPRLVAAIGPVRTGIWALSCLIRGDVRVLGLVGGVALSRVGLWGYDLAAQMIIQEEVAEPLRGSFSSIEASAQNFFELLAFTITAVFHRPDQFYIPALISFGAVASASLLYTRFVKLRRGHLFHAPICLKHRE